MKRILLAMLLLALCAAPVLGAVSPIKTDFQDYSVITTWPTTQGDWRFVTQYTPSTLDTYGHVAISPSGTLISLTPHQFTYAAFTTGTYTSIGITLQNAAGGSLWNTGGTLNAGRMEIIIIAGVARFYNNGALVATSSALSENPSYLYLANSVFVTNIDDIVVGYSDDSTIIGPPPSNWFILYDSLAPASTGLYQTNATLGGNPILKNSNYFGVSYGRGTSAATTLQLISPAGAVVHSYPVANMSCQAALPIADLYQDGVIAPGYWTVQLADSPLAQKHFWVLSGTAAVSMDKTSYLTGDTGIATYSIPSSYWDPTTYSYKLRLVDIYGTQLEEYSIAGPSSSQSVSFATTDGAGVRFIEIVRIKTSDSTESIIGYTSTTVYEYLGFRGVTYDANTTLPLAGVAYNFTQSGTIVTGTSGFDGNYSVGGFGTGSRLFYNFTYPGKRAWNFTIDNPLSTGYKTLDIALYPSSPAVSNVTIGGVIHDSVYGNIIPSATVTATNGTTISTTANIRGGYMIPGLTAGTCYAMGATKTGFLFASPTSPVCVVSS